MTTPTPEELEQARQIVESCVSTINFLPEGAEPTPLDEYKLATIEGLAARIASALHERFNEGVEAAADVVGIYLRAATDRRNREPPE